MAARKKYSEKLRDPRWQKKRLEVLERDHWACQMCFDTKSTLHVHHRYYSGDPWESPLEALVTLCEGCHAEEGDQRRVAEQRLVAAVRKHFFSADITQIAKGFEEMEVVYSENVLADAIGDVVGRPDQLRALVSIYFERLEREVFNEKTPGEGGDAGR